MAITVTIGDGDEIVLEQTCVRKVSYSTDIPLDSDARTKDVGSTLTIEGRILSQEDDGTKALNDWGLMAAEEEECYRQVVVEVTTGSITQRKYTFTHAFVIYQKESYGSSEGIGTFTLIVKQRKDKNGEVDIDGAFS